MTPGGSPTFRAACASTPDRTDGRVALPLALAVALTFALLPACKPYRIERHVRPGFYQSASQSALPDQIELPDGTIVEYVAGKPAAPPGGDDSDAELFEIREEHDDGTVTVRCLLPEHVIANTMTCLRFEEYDVMWDQLLAKSTRAGYASEGLGFEDFAESMASERPEIMTTLNRMSFGYLGQDVILESGARGAMRVRLGPRLSSEFRFTAVEMVMEKDGMKLERIR